MAFEDLREKLLAEVASVDATALLPHHRRGALILLSREEDLLAAAVAIAADDANTIDALVARGALTRPTLAQLADWCVDAAQRFQVLILQPYVLAQLIDPRGI